MAPDSRREPWLPINSDYRSRNAASQDADPLSLLSWYRSLIVLRRSRPSLREGSMGFLDLGPDILAYERVDSSAESTVILLNFSSRRRNIVLEKKLQCSWAALGKGHGAGRR